MFSQLSDGLEGVFKKLKGQGKISEKNISDAISEIVENGYRTQDMGGNTTTSNFVAALLEKI